jgi:L-2-hydroxycarboxylate dehydrogenase (NAD+)
MFDYLHVSDDIAIRIQGDDMRATVENMFQHMGAPKEDAKRSADALLYADMRGIDSHGVSNMLRYYISLIEEGKLNPAPVMKVVTDAPAVATVDSDNGLGLTIGPQAMELAMTKAEVCGMGAVAVNNGQHFGAAGYHAQLAMPRNMIGVAMTQGGVYMVPTFAANPMVGVNPIGFAAPAREEAPFIFDASSSSVAMNKIFLARRLGVNIPGSWLADADGTPVLEEGPPPEDFRMLPVGGTREIGSHKAYSLAVMADILCGVLSGGGPGFAGRPGICHHFIAYRIDAFTDLEVFKDDMDFFMKSLRECTPAPGHDRVLYAGLPEYEAYQDRSVNGIPYHPEVIDWFRQKTAELGVEHYLGDGR